MFFSNGYVETERQQRMPTPCSADEHDILRELLLDGDFASPRLPLPSSTKHLALSKRQHHMELSIPQICFDNNAHGRFPPPSQLSGRSAGSSLLGGFNTQSSLPSSIMNSIISPPRVFIQEFARLHPPFFHDNLTSSSSSTSSTITSSSSEVEDGYYDARPIKSEASMMSHLPPPPLPMLTMPPLKKHKGSGSTSASRSSSATSSILAPVNTTNSYNVNNNNNNNSNRGSKADSHNNGNNNNNSSTDLGIHSNGRIKATPSPAPGTSSGSSERKQLRCSYPDCPNLRRSAGFCNRHSGKVCSISGCLKSALSRGKCPEHGGGSRCKREGCSKFAQTRGLCKSHGGGRQCNVAGCSKNAHQNRLCRSHGGGKRCDFYGCPKWAQRSGYCCAHTKLGHPLVSQNGLPSLNSLPFPSSSGSTPSSLSQTLATSSSITHSSILSPPLMSPHRLLSLLP